MPTIKEFLESTKDPVVKSAVQYSLTIGELTETARLDSKALNVLEQRMQAATRVLEEMRGQTSLEFVPDPLLGFGIPFGTLLEGGESCTVCITTFVTTAFHYSGFKPGDTEFLGFKNEIAVGCLCYTAQESHRPSNRFDCLDETSWDILKGLYTVQHPSEQASRVRTLLEYALEDLKTNRVKFRFVPACCEPLPNFMREEERLAISAAIERGLIDNELC